VPRKDSQRQRGPQQEWPRTPIARLM